MGSDFGATARHMLVAAVSLIEFAEINFSSSNKLMA